MILIYTITIVFLITLFDAYLNIRYGITFTDIYYTDGYSLKYDVNASENKNFTLYDKPPYSLEKLGQWGDFLGGHFNVLAFLMLTITVLLQYKSTLVQSANNAMDRIERLYSACDIYENNHQIKTILGGKTLDPKKIKNLEDFNSAIGKLHSLYNLIQKEIDNIEDIDTKKHEKEKFDILKKHNYVNIQKTIENQKNNHTLCK
ncbi:hypothetical protein [Sulfurospirillum sp. UCH001]|uniref:hypothetical protein n=1 Tax=Sulfurospirillum sp. UCH001 TaxID=1581011 RepID=UPI000829BA3F|nr:hypothetical protein [Sulfurospirillum sp. UCH001]